MRVPSYTGHFQVPYLLGLPAKHGYIYCVGIAPATWQPPSLQWAVPISSSAMGKCSHPSSLHLQLSHPKAQPHTRCSWQSRGRRSELPVWCWGLVTRLFVCLSLPCLCCAYSPGVTLCLGCLRAAQLRLHFYAGTRPSLPLSPRAGWRESDLTGRGCRRSVILTSFPFCTYRNQVLDSNQDLLP